MPTPNQKDFENYLLANGVVKTYHVYHMSLNTTDFCNLANDVLSRLVPTLTYTSCYSFTDLDILKAIDDRIAANGPTDTLLIDAMRYSNWAGKSALLYYVGYLRDEGLATNEKNQQFQVLRGNRNIAKNPLLSGGTSSAPKPDVRGMIPTSTKPYNGPLNLILYGPPGTGKTYNSINYAVAIIENKDISVIESEDRDTVRERYSDYVDKGQIVFTTFHQSLSYEDFIEGIKPEYDSALSILKYPIKPGIFKKMVDEINKPATTEGDDKPRYVLIIDEINRGNVSQIFGELITLIEEDKRKDNTEAMSAKLPYSGEQFSVPNNLYILGTMNTADRSVEALDTALRRRFSFKEMVPQPDLLSENLCDHNLKDILDRINQRIAYLKDREHQIGHSYFIGCDSEAKLKCIFKDKIVPLLQEYFYGNVEYIGLTLGNEFIKPVNTVTFPTINGIDSPSEPSANYRVLTDGEWNTLNIKNAIDELMK